MSFAMCMGGEMLIAILVFFVAVGGACLALAIFATVGLARWAAARHNRLAANPR
ncbi:MAG TPA: hypothetical protein VN282_28365 [Pyrinomonadaceae bacterium]|nr:hypothetical protein [Pyrinomonadaceae bacterium]